MKAVKGVELALRDTPEVKAKLGLEARLKVSLKATAADQDCVTPIAVFELSLRAVTKAS